MCKVCTKSNLPRWSTLYQSNSQTNPEPKTQSWYQRFKQLQLQFPRPNKEGEKTKAASYTRLLSLWGLGRPGVHTALSIHTPVHGDFVFMFQTRDITLTMKVGKPSPSQKAKKKALRAMWPRGCKNEIVERVFSMKKFWDINIYLTSIWNNIKRTMWKLFAISGF